MNDNVLVFRADGNSNVGAGHIMRCLSIADAALDRGIESVFITASEEFKEIVETHKHTCHVMYTDYQRMCDEMSIFTDIISNYIPEVLFVDSYYVSDQYFELLRRSLKCKIAYIDDMAMFGYDCDYLINYNIYGSLWEEKYKNFYEEGKIPKLILGSQYVPLRSEFRENKRESIHEEGSDILISTGGADPDHFALALIKSILQISGKKKFHIIVGAMNNDKYEIRERTNHCKNIFIHEKVNKMAKLMLSCDVAISAAGSTLYELCSTQTPTITYVLEDNQVFGANAFEKSGVIQNAGDIRKCGLQTLADRLINEAIKLCDDYDQRKAIATRQNEVVDGLGAYRIIDAVCRF